MVEKNAMQEWIDDLNRREREHMEQVWRDQDAVNSLKYAILGGVVSARFKHGKSLFRSYNEAH
jgi:hypothetical protein